MKAFVINLPHHQERRRSITQQAAAMGLVLEVVEACNGREMAAEHLEARVAFAKRLTLGLTPLSLGEIGCALSHIGVYQRIVDEQIPQALILEDDAQLGCELPAILGHLETWRRQEAGQADEASVHLLSYVRKYTGWGKRRLSARHERVRVVNAVYTHGYVINLPAAKALLEQLYPVWQVADCWDYLQRKQIVNVYGILPYCIGQSQLARQSSIESERASKPKFRRTVFELCRHYLYRKFFYQLSIRPLLRHRKPRQTW
ncbi:glycosyltransferase family 25 protein [Neisseriaceae bacterium JH1-16]|nr:glycosyltransferase family 25 protein [Neisseriaceae bacterium JH1-16]